MSSDTQADGNTEARAEQIEAIYHALINVVLTNVPSAVFQKISLSADDKQAIFEPLCKELYLELSKGSASLQDLELTLGTLQVVMNETLQRVYNHTVEASKYVYQHKIGCANPITEMPISAWEEQRIEIANKQLSTGDASTEVATPATGDTV